MKTQLSILSVILILCTWSLESKSKAPTDIKFNVYRNSNLIGFHNLSFSKLGNDIKAEIEIKFEAQEGNAEVMEEYHLEDVDFSEFY